MTDMTVGSPDPAARLPVDFEDSLDYEPMIRMATPGEIAAGIIHLSHSSSSYINGAVLSIDGGRYATR